MIRCLILVEGQCEKAFISEVLSPHLKAWGLNTLPVDIKTSRPASGPTHRGGIPTFGRVRKELQKLLVDRQAVVSTMIDYFRLPSDTPGLAGRRTLGHPRHRADHISRAIEAQFPRHPHFHVYLSLHEFEALVLAAPKALAEVLGDARLLEPLATIVTGHNPPEPEAVNDSPATAPAARIHAVAPQFRKFRDGPTVLERAGLPHLRAACPHFDAWVTLLESYGTPPSPSP